MRGSTSHTTLLLPALMNTADGVVAVLTIARKASAYQRSPKARNPRIRMVDAPVDGLMAAWISETSPSLRYRSADIRSATGTLA
jgi:hypothetical protein